MWALGCCKVSEFFLFEIMCVCVCTYHVTHYPTFDQYVASFIFGYAISLLLSGHYVHKIRWKPLVCSGLCVWWLGVLGSGNAKQYNSFYVLLFSRMATGCSEAAFQVVAPPLIQDRGGKHTGLWLSIYLTGLPVGLAFGYVYGSFIASSDRWGWDWAYYFMCIASVPPLMVMMVVKDENNGGILGGAGESIEVESCGCEDDNGDSEGNRENYGLAAHEPLLASSIDEDDANHERHSNHRTFTVFSEIQACLSSPILVTVAVGWAAIIGVVASLGTFGGAYVLALQLYDNEREAAYWFGISAALAGVVGTPIGGRLADKVLDRYVNSMDGSARSGEGVDDALRQPIIASMLSRINMLVVISMVFVFPTLAMQEAAFFLAFLIIGWTLLCKFGFMLQCCAFSTFVH
jgi:MFS family permease